MLASASGKITGLSKNQVHGASVAHRYGVPKSLDSLPSEFVSGIKGNELSEILGAAGVVKLAAQKIIVREGTPSTHLFLLKSGGAKFFLEVWRRQVFPLNA